MIAITRVLDVALGVLSSLRAAGVVKSSSPLQDVALRDLANVSTAVHNYEDGQAVIAGTFHENGTKGYIVLVKEGGATAEALGLS